MVVGNPPVAVVAVPRTGSMWPVALELLLRARRVANVVTVNAAITACGKGSQWQMALRLLQESLYGNGPGSKPWHLSEAQNSW